LRVKAKAGGTAARLRRARPPRQGETCVKACTAAGKCDKLLGERRAAHPPPGGAPGAAAASGKEREGMK